MMTAEQRLDKFYKFGVSLSAAFIDLVQTGQATVEIVIIAIYVCIAIFCTQQNPYKKNLANTIFEVYLSLLEYYMNIHCLYVF